ncbi:hypothetical protein Hanom_Chr04g00340691 [Helianthus anomalus]
MEECYIPSTTDWFDGWDPSEHISDLNLEDMNIGTQTQKELDYCSTPLQLTGVIYDVAAREGLNKNKKVQSFGFLFMILLITHALRTSYYSRILVYDIRKITPVQ